MSQPDFADVAVKPPLLFLGAVVVGLLLLKGCVGGEESKGEWCWLVR
jgi:hypothetical protein